MFVFSIASYISWHRNTLYNSKFLFSFIQRFHMVFLAIESKYKSAFFLYLQQDFVLLSPSSAKTEGIQTCLGFYSLSYLRGRHDLVGTIRAAAKPLQDCLQPRSNRLLGGHVFAAMPLLQLQNEEEWSLKRRLTTENSLFRFSKN